MRIAYFTDTYYPEVNGIVTSILKSSERLALRGHKIMIFCPKYAKDNKVPKLHKNIKVVRSFSLPLITYEDVRISWPNHASILRKVRRFKPDVIHMHTPGPVSGAAIICSTLLRKPLVGTFHTLVTEQLDYASFRNLPPVARMKAMLRYMKNLTGILDRMPGRTGGKSRHSYTRRLKWLAGKIGEMKIRNRKVSSVIKRQIKKP
ncbi:glycosyltransferase, partial [Candidatus Woesearchaeota archaeon]|nr:glycosyltransferase [Candidatus Woesearchaeota archaeon]